MQTDYYNGHPRPFAAQLPDHLRWRQLGLGNRPSSIYLCLVYELSTFVKYDFSRQMPPWPFMLKRTPSRNFDATHQWIAPFLVFCPNSSLSSIHNRQANLQGTGVEVGVDGGSNHWAFLVLLCLFRPCGKPIKILMTRLFAKGSLWFWVFLLARAGTDIWLFFTFLLLGACYIAWHQSMSQHGLYQIQEIVYIGQLWSFGLIHCLLKAMSTVARHVSSYLCVCHWGRYNDWCW